MPGLRLRSTFCAAAILLAALMFSCLPGCAEDVPTCRGSDMLAEWAQTDPQSLAAIMAEASATANAEAVLWRIEARGKPPSYLFGTVHLTDDRVATLSPKLLDIIAQSKAVALEVADLSEAATSAAIAKSIDLVVYTDGRSLSDALAADELEQVRKLVAKSGMPGELAPSLRPWIVTMLLAVSDCERQRNQAGRKVLDMAIAEAARSKGVEVVGLEQIEEQLSALASISEDQQIDMLRTGLKFEHRSDDVMETLVQLYRKRQMGAALPFQLTIARKAGVAPTAFADFQEKLLDKRNIKMRDGALPLIADGPVLIAVGALHLPGKNGLVALLREAGYTVTPVE